ncbi:MAG TPA: hypothetical protein ENJ64_07195 [Thiotrichales bacterium]|nr:hypothetical protein [Thiotrichales bacterium]
MLIPVLLVVSALQANQPIVLKQPGITVELTPRSPNQMGSFNEARGFPRPMLTLLKKQCYITIGIENTGRQKIWFDLKNWRFSVNGKALEREHRDVWMQRWAEMGVPLSKQSTFRWTLIPEQLDYLPGEREGGNIILPFTSAMIRLDATLQTGENRQGKPIHIHYDALYCAEDAPAEQE